MRILSRSRRDLFEASTSQQQQLQHQQQQQQQAQQAAAAAAANSVFRESPLSSSEITNHLRDELKRLRKRKHDSPFASNSPPSSPEPMDDHTAMRTASQALSVNTASPFMGMAGPSSPRSPKSADKPVFTLRQMTLICERMCKVRVLSTFGTSSLTNVACSYVFFQERTDHVRAEYDRILQMKLAEQYEAFVKFIDHQVHQRLNESQLPSYLS